MRRVNVVWGVLAILVALPTVHVAVGKAAPLQVQAKRDLVFGDVMPGVPLTMAYIDGNAGHFKIKGNKNAEVQIAFILPATLDGGGDTMPVTFGNNAGGYNQKNNPAQATPFDPNVGFVTRLGNSGQLRIWIGGTAQPKGTQQPGAYQSPITMEMLYTGN